MTSWMHPEPVPGLRPTSSCWLTFHSRVFVAGQFTGCLKCTDLSLEVLKHSPYTL